MKIDETKDAHWQYEHEAIRLSRLLLMEIPGRKRHSELLKQYWEVRKMEIETMPDK